MEFQHQNMEFHLQNMDFNLQKMEFQIIDGYYFDEGRNDTIKHVIKYLYDLYLILYYQF